MQSVAGSAGFVTEKTDDSSSYCTPKVMRDADDVKEGRGGEGGGGGLPAPQRRRGGRVHRPDMLALP